MTDHTRAAQFAVLEVCQPLPRSWPSRWEAVLGRRGEPELLVVASGARRVPPLLVLADGVDVAVLAALDEQARPWAERHARDATDPTAAYVAHLVEAYVAKHTQPTREEDR